MNFLILLIDSIVAFVRRNPIFCLGILLLALLAPSVLRGIAAFAVYFILGAVLFAVAALLLFRWRIGRMQRRVEDAFRNSAGPDFGAPGGPGSGPEGEVKIYKTRETPEKRIADDVGDYVDFEETKEN